MREDAANVARRGGLRPTSRRALVVADAARPAAFVIAKVNRRHDELLAAPPRTTSAMRSCLFG
jgi:hypothetical protein